jgi:prepilin peptidase CpaA
MNSLTAVFTHSGVDLMFGVAFTVLMVVAARLDVRSRRIPNAIALLTFVLGAVFATSMVGPRDAAVRVLQGTGTGMALWLPFWALGMLGGGDVKFFAAASAWLGPRLALEAAVVSAALGGVLALWWLLRRGTWGSTTMPERSGVVLAPRGDSSGAGGVELDVRERTIMLPYGVAMAAGLAVTAWFPHLIH